MDSASISAAVGLLESSSKIKKTHQMMEEELVTISKAITNSVKYILDPKSNVLRNCRTFATEITTMAKLSQDLSCELFFVELQVP